MQQPLARTDMPLLTYTVAADTDKKRLEPVRSNDAQLAKTMDRLADTIRILVPLATAHTIQDRRKVHMLKMENSQQMEYGTLSDFLPLLLRDIPALAALHLIHCCFL